jgi:hypothetical protein
MSFEKTMKRASSQNKQNQSLHSNMCLEDHAMLNKITKFYMRKFS